MDCEVSCFGCSSRLCFLVVMRYSCSIYESSEILCHIWWYWDEWSYWWSSPLASKISSQRPRSLSLCQSLSEARKPTLHSSCDEWQSMSSLA